MTEVQASTPVLLPAISLWRREVVRFLRQRSRIVGALATPILFWLLIGSGMGRSFRASGGETHYLEYLFPGTVIMIVLFTAIFSTISIIEDRREGFLQSVLVAPVPRAAIVLGKTLGATTLAVGQAVLFAVLAPLVGVKLTLLGAAAALGALLLIGVGLAALGFVIAWSMDSIQGFHAIMNLVLMPMWLLSGALFPVSGASAWLGWVMLANPLTYGLALFRHALAIGVDGERLGGPSAAAAFAVSVAFTAAMFVLAARVARRGARGT